MKRYRGVLRKWEETAHTSAHLRFEKVDKTDILLRYSYLREEKAYFWIVWEGRRDRHSLWKYWYERRQSTYVRQEFWFRDMWLSHMSFDSQRIDVIIWAE